MRQFTSVSQFVVCLKGSATLRVIDVEGDVQFYNRKNTKSGMMESIPYFRGVLQDHTGPIRATWWNMLPEHATFRGLQGQTVLCQGFSVAVAHPRFSDLNRFSISFDGTKGGAMRPCADIGTIPIEMVVPAIGGAPTLAIGGPLDITPTAGALGMVPSWVSPSPAGRSTPGTPIKREGDPATDACCERMDMPFCLLRPGVRHVPRCPHCQRMINDPKSPVCGMTGALHMPSTTTTNDAVLVRVMNFGDDADTDIDADKTDKTA